MPHCYTAKSHTLRQVRLSLGAGYSKSLCKVSNPSNPTRQFHCAVQSEAQYHSYPDPISCYVWYFVFASCTKSPVNSKNTGFQSNKEAAWLDIVHKHRQTNPLWIWSNWPPRSAAAIALQGLSCWAQTSQQFDPAPAIGTSVSDERNSMHVLIATTAMTAQCPGIHHPSKSLGWLLHSWLAFLLLSAVQAVCSMSLFTSFKAKLERHYVVHFKTGWRFQPKNVSQIGPFPQVGVKIKKWNHRPEDLFWSRGCFTCEVMSFILTSWSSSLPCIVP